MEALIFKQARARPPLHEADGRYTHGQVRRCIVATDPHDLHLSTRGFAALHAQQLAPCSSSQLFGGSHKLRAQARAERVEIGQKWSIGRSGSGLWLALGCTLRKQRDLAP